MNYQNSYAEIETQNSKIHVQINKRNEVIRDYNLTHALYIKQIGHSEKKAAKLMVNNMDSLLNQINNYNDVIESLYKEKYELENLLYMRFRKDAVQDMKNLKQLKESYSLLLSEIKLTLPQLTELITKMYLCLKKSSPSHLFFTSPYFFNNQNSYNCKCNEMLLFNDSMKAYAELAKKTDYKYIESIKEFPYTNVILTPIKVTVTVRAEYIIDFSDVNSNRELLMSHISALESFATYLHSIQKDYENTIKYGLVTK